MEQNFWWRNVSKEEEEESRSGGLDRAINRGEWSRQEKREIRWWQFPSSRHQDGGGIVRSGGSASYTAYTSGSTRKTLSSREQTRWAEKLAAQVSNRNESAMVSVECGSWAGREAKAGGAGGHGRHEPSLAAREHPPLRWGSFLLPSWPVSGLSAT